MTTRPWFSIALLVLVGVLLAQAPVLAPTSRLAPLWVLVPTAVLLVLQLLVELKPGLGARITILQRTAVTSDLHGSGADASGSDGEGTHAPTGDPKSRDEVHAARERRRRELRVVLWIGWLVGLLYLGGFLVATSLFLLPYLRTESGLGWARSVSLTVAATALVYLVFGVLVRVPFPQPALF